MAISLVQSKSVSAASGTSATVTLTSNTTAGNCLVVCIEFSGVPTITGVTLGGVADNFAAAVASSPYIWTDKNCAGGQNSIVVSLSATSGVINIWAMEFSGVDTSAPVDKTNNATQAVLGTFTSGATGTLTQANEVVIGAADVSGTNDVAITGPGAPWTELGTLGIAGLRFITGYQIVSATTSITYNGTTSGTSGGSAGSIVSLKAQSNTTSTGAMTLNMAMAGTANNGVVTSTGAMSLNMAMSGSATHPVFPQAVLGLGADLQLNGVWNDISTYVYQRNGAVKITRGRPDESTNTNPSQLTAEMNNRDGRFSPRNPNGAYYGNLGRNTPFRLSVFPDQSTYLRMEDDAISYASAPDAAGLDPTGDFELRMDIQPSNYQHPLGVSIRLAQKYTSPSQRSWILELHTGGFPKFFMSPDGSNIFSATSNAVLPLGRISLKVTYNHTTGDVIFYTASSINGTYTQLGSTQNVGTTGAIFDSTSPVKIGTELLITMNGVNVDESFNGRVYGLQIRNGIGGSTVVNADFTAATAGVSTYTDSNSNVWTVAGTAEFSSKNYRFHGEVSSWPQRWDVTGTDVYTPIQANGILRRLGQGSKPLNSAMYRGYTRLTGTAIPVCYWPCEDGANSTQIAEATGNGSAIQVSGTTTFAADSSFACSSPLPQIGSSTWLGTIPSYTNPASNPANVLRFLLHVPSGGTTDATILAQMYTGGSVHYVTLTYGTVNGGSLRFQGYNSSGTQLFDSAYLAFYSGGINGKTLRVSLELQTSGSSVQWSIVTLKPGDTVGQSSTGTLASSTVNVGTKIQFNPNSGVLGNTSIGHISFQSSWDNLFDLSSPLQAWAGETAGDRFIRLLFEEGIPYRVYGHPANTRAMGNQLPKKLTDLLQECEDADGGMIFEPRESLSVGYRCRESLENQAAAVTLSYTNADLGKDSSTGLEPTDDDQYTRNDITVSKANGGSSSRQVLTTGALSNQSPPNGVGTYADSKTISLFLDSQLDDQAGWLLNLGTVNEPRYPVIPVNLARTEISGNNTKYYGLLSLKVGDFLDITSPPSWLPPGDIKQIIAGWTENLGGFIFNMELHGIPESPYEVGLAGSGATTDYRVDTDGSTLSAGITNSATSISVATTAQTTESINLWTTAAGDFPLDIMIGGERMTVTNITGSSSPQTFTVTRSVNGIVKVHNSGEAVNVFKGAVVGLDDPN